MEKLQLLHIQYIDFIPHCSVLKKVVRRKTRGAAAKNRWTLPLKICIYPGMKKGCLRSIETSGDAMDDQMHMLRIHRVVKLTPSHYTNILNGLFQIG